MSDTILALLGFATVIAVIVLLLRNVTVPALAFVGVSTITAAILVATGAFTLDEMAGFIKEGVKGVHGTAILFIFSVLFFGVMTDAGMFDKIIGALMKKVGNNVIGVALMTCLIAIIGHLDGGGASTFLITIPAMLPVYKRLHMRRETLLLICEEGEEEYNEKKFAFPGVTVKVLEDKSELNPQNLAKLGKEADAGRVVIEYNGMWLLQDLADALPENWLVYQCIATADGTTALTYARDNSMRSLLLDKIARSELIVFNRAEAVNNDEARQELHRLVRQASRKCDIAYEFKDGSVAYDDIPDPLPFDVNAPVIDIHDDDFGIWYMDCQDEPQKYTGKTVKFLAQVCQTNRAGKNSFVPGRFAMTCCVQDIQFVGFPCSYDGYKALEQRSWVRVTAKVGYKFHNIYRGKGPVLTAISVEPAEKPLNEVVTFS